MLQKYVSLGTGDGAARSDVQCNSAVALPLQMERCATAGLGSIIIAIVIIIIIAINSTMTAELQAAPGP